MRRFQRLRNGVRRHKETLVKRAVDAVRRATLAADARHRHTCSRTLDELMRTGEVRAAGAPARRRDFNQGTHHKVRAVLRRLRFSTNSP